MNLFQRAFAGSALTPGERALLKLLQGFALAGVQSALLLAPSLIALNGGQVTIAAGGFGMMLGAFVHGLIAAYQKYASAKGDAPLPIAAPQPAEIPVGGPGIPPTDSPASAALDVPLQQAA